MNTLDYSEVAEVTIEVANGQFYLVVTTFEGSANKRHRLRLNGQSFWKLAAKTLLIAAGN